MSTSKQTFSQVKDILRKIDRSIEDARERRLSGAPGGPGGRTAQPAGGPRTDIARDATRPDEE
ncbi:MAG: hypothetical protein EA379_07395 [Phycisphaerales bacterium]|nr:MAG: hypothetical protein EA379_07395 [Phycisphaerales bacterium]